jgi:hypothetical protein
MPDLLETIAMTQEGGEQPCLKPNVIGTAC